MLRRIPGQGHISRRSSRVCWAGQFDRRRARRRSWSAAGGVQCRVPQRCGGGSRVPATASARSSARRSSSPSPLRSWSVSRILRAWPSACSARRRSPMRTARSARSTSARSCSVADRAASDARMWSRSLAAAGWSPLESPSNAAVCRALANRAVGGGVWAKSSEMGDRSAGCCRRGRSPGTGARRRRCPAAARSGAARGLGACRARRAAGCGTRHTARRRRWW
jgi:hypothetical protein